MRIIQWLRIFFYWMRIARYEYYIDKASENGEQKYIKTPIRRKK